MVHLIVVAAVSASSRNAEIRSRWSLSTPRRSARASSTSHTSWRTTDTESELVKRWWSGERGEMTIAEIELRVGGAWRYVMVTDEGFEVAFHGEYREIVANERIVSTEVYDGMLEGEALNTVTFGETEGRTILTVFVEHASKEAAVARRRVRGDLDEGWVDLAVPGTTRQVGQGANTVSHQRS